MLKLNNIFIFFVLFLFTCDFNQDEGDDSELISEKAFQVDSDGNVIETEILISDFLSAHDCFECHQQHFEEWSNSMHASSFSDPLFFSMWITERQERPLTGHNYCIQCHAPTAYTADYDMSDITTLEELTQLPSSIIEGVTCTFCHTMVGNSHSVFTEDNVAATIGFEIDNGEHESDYHLNPGEGVFYGSINQPEENSFHESHTLGLFSESISCLPCHDQVIRGKEVETTFTEWNRVPGFGMGGGNSCQSCHMPESNDGYHDHTFAGVDINFDDPFNQDLLDANQMLLETALYMEFGDLSDIDISELDIGHTLEIPIEIESFTGHRFPSGTSFTREAWLELIVSNEGDILFSSGVINNSLERLDLDDENLLLFTTWLLDENGDTTYKAGNTHDFIDRSLPALENRHHTYYFIIESQLPEILEIDARMRFRPLKPETFSDSNYDLISDVPIYNLIEIEATID